MSIFLGQKIRTSDLPPKYDPIGVSTRQSDGETSDPFKADARNFYKVEKWTKDGSKVESMLYAGGNLDKAREVFAAAIKAPATDPADHSAAVAGAGTMAGAAGIAALKRQRCDVSITFSASATIRRRPR